MEAERNLGLKMRKGWKNLIPSRLAMVAVLVFLGRGAQAQTFTWNVGTGNWNNNANWNPSTGQPDTSAEIAVFNSGTTSVLDSSRTVGTIIFGADNNFTISGSSTGTIQTNITAASPDATGRIYTISAPVNLGANNTWNVAANTVFSLTNTVDDGGPNFGFTKTGDGLVVLSGVNGFDGAIVLSTGTVSINSFSSLNNASAIGESSTITFNGGAMQYTGGGHSGSRVFTLGTSGGIIDASGTGALNLTSTTAIAFTGSGARTLTLTGSNTGANTLAAPIGNSGGSTSLVKSGSGKWVLSGDNTYTGTTTINGGTLGVTALDNSSGSHIGQAGNSLVLNGGVLRWESTANNTAGSSSRSFTLGAGGGGFDASATDPSGSALTISGTMGLSADSDVRVFTLFGDNADNNTLSSALTSGSGKVAALIKEGPGTWLLTGNNTDFSAEVEVRGGMISLDGTESTLAGRLSAAPKITILQGGTFRLNNDSDNDAQDDRILDTSTIELRGGTMDFAGRAASSAGDRSTEAAGKLLLTDGASTLTIANSSGSSTAASLTLNDATDGLARNAGATLRFVDDSLALVTVAKHTEINNIIGGWALFGSGTFAALSNAGTGNFIGGAVDDATLDPSNWGATENVRIAGAASFNSATSRTINSLAQVDSTGRTITISSGKTLTIESGGIILTGAGHTIAGPGTLTAGAAGAINQYELIVHTTSANTGTISAIIADNSAASQPIAFTKSGIGTLALTSSNPYSGATYVSQGTLSLSGSSNNLLPSTSKIIVARGATLNLAGLTSGSLNLNSGQILGGGGIVRGGVNATALDVTIAPGASPGQLTFAGSGAITLGSDTIVEMQIAGKYSNTGTAGYDYDQIVVDGGGSAKTLTPGSARLKLVAMPGIVAGQSYTIVSATNSGAVATASYFRTLGGTLMDNEATTYTQGNLSFTIDYSSTSVSVTFSAVPEPGSMALVLLAAPAILRRRRR